MIRSNLKYSIIEGSFFALMFGLGENYLSALYVYMGFSALKISLLSSFPQLVGSVAQLFTLKLSRMYRSDKSFVVSLSLLQSLMWAILVIIIMNSTSFWILLIWATTYFSISSVIAPVWISWMGYIVPQRIRPTYHANRNRIINMSIFFSIMLGGLILRWFDSNLIYAFTIMFSLGVIGRLISALFLNKKSISKRENKSDDCSYSEIFRDKMKRLYILYSTSISFSVMFLGPLFTIYILRTMQLDYIVLTLCMCSWWVGNVLSSNFWGRLTKEIGNLSVLKLTTFLMCGLPVLWISVYYLSEFGRVIGSICINILAGVTFSGYGLSSFNIVYDISKESEIVKFTSLINCIRGIGVFVGSILAGLIVDSLYLQSLLSNVDFTTIQLSMIISIVLRCLSYLFLISLKV